MVTQVVWSELVLATASACDGLRMRTLCYIPSLALAIHAWFAPSPTKYQSLQSVEVGHTTEEEENEADSNGIMFFKVFLQPHVCKWHGSCPS